MIETDEAKERVLNEIEGLIGTDGYIWGYTTYGRCSMYRGFEGMNDDRVPVYEIRQVHSTDTGEQIFSDFAVDLSGNVIEAESYRDYGGGRISDEEFEDYRLPLQSSLEEIVFSFRKMSQYKGFQLQEEARAAVLELGLLSEDDLLE